MPGAHPRHAEAEAEHVVVAPRQRIVQGEAAVDGEADRIAVLKRCHLRPQEGADGAVRVARAPDHLIRGGVDRIVALLLRGNPVARGVGERDAHIVGLLTVEVLAVPPGPDLVRAGKRAVGRRLSRRNGCGNRRILNSAIASTPVLSGKLTPLGLLSGVLGEFSGIGLPLKTPAMMVTASVGAPASADAEAGEGIGGSAAGRIRRRQHRPAHHRVQEVAGILAHHEFVVEALLADLDVEGGPKFCCHQSSQSRIEAKASRPLTVCRFIRLEGLTAPPQM